jgi:hypothetical protein
MRYFADIFIKELYVYQTTEDADNKEYQYNLYCRQP